MKQVYLYGLAGARDQYRVVRYSLLGDEAITVGNIKHEAEMMRIRYPNIEHVYAVDQRYGLRRDYIDSIKKNTIESCAIFKDLIQREGLEVF